MAKIHNAGFGGTMIKISTDEITNIYQKIQTILSEFENNIIPKVDLLSNLKYYQKGKANEAMNVYKQANKKVEEIYVHYNRASSLIVEILNQMIAADKKIANEIIKKLGL